LPLTFILLQTLNFIFAGSSAWIHFKDPLLWDDQAILVSVGAGTVCASITAVLLGLNLVFREDNKFIPSLINLLLGLAFGAGQGYLLYLIGRDYEILKLIKSQFG
jgi:hypothetical protein